MTYVDFSSVNRYLERIADALEGIESLMERQVEVSLPASTRESPAQRRRRYRLAQEARREQERKQERRDYPG